MNKILITTNILLLGLSGYLFFRSQKPNIPKTGTIITQVATPPDSCSYKICVDYSSDPWKGRISGYVAQLIANNYKEDPGKNSIWNGTTKTDSADARSAWFPLSTIKRYIWEIEMRNCNSHCEDSLGIRIYYGRYPDAADGIWAENGMIPQLKYANRHTLFMVPTYWDKQWNAHFDFNPWTEGCHKPIYKKPLTGSETFTFYPVLLIGGDDAQNHGSLIPPDAPRGTDF